MAKTRRARKSKHSRSRKQKVWLMRGCSHKKGSKCALCANKGKGVSNGCPNCGPNCHCGPNCNCPHPCPGNCYLNRRHGHKTGGSSGCGPSGCPLAPLSWAKMNSSQFRGGSASVLGDNYQTSYPPILGSVQNGGCGCGNPLMSGGAGVPGPFVGQAWGAPVSKWPGVDGVSGNRNFLANYGPVIKNDPALQQSLNDGTYKDFVGGYTYKEKSRSKKGTKSSASSSRSSNSSRSSKSSRTSSSSVSFRKHKHRHMKGGASLVPQDLVNLGNDFSYNMKSFYNAINGYKAPVNPAPYVQNPGSQLADKW